MFAHQAVAQGAAIQAGILDGQITNLFVMDVWQASLMRALAKHQQEGTWAVLLWDCRGGRRLVDGRGRDWGGMGRLNCSFTPLPAAWHNAGKEEEGGGSSEASSTETSDDLVDDFDDDPLEAQLRDLRGSGDLS